MRNALKSSGRWLGAGWFWPLVLLVLPNCQLDQSGLTNPNHFNPGSDDLSFAVMCDIPHVPMNPAGDCANPMDIQTGIPKAKAAIALFQGENKSLVLDFSQDAQNACGIGVPRKIQMFDGFPFGTTVCLNCPQMIGNGGPYDDRKAVCFAKCKELVGVDGPEPPGGLDAYCTANGNLSTNFDPASCYASACSVSDGIPLKNFADPRRDQEPVKWVDLINTSAPDNTLTKTAGAFGVFDAGGASAPETFTFGDGWVEFEAGENNLPHALGVSHNTGNDVDPSLADIGFAIRLRNDGTFIINEGGVDVGPSLGTYAAGDRFRVKIKDNNDVAHTATISYSKLTRLSGSGACTPVTCSETEIATQTNPSPLYPLRVDASLGAVGASLVNVTLVRIKTFP